MDRAEKLKYSPSLHNRYLIRNLRPTHAYRRGNVRKWQTRTRRKLKELLRIGGEPEVPLRPRTLWTRRHPLGTIEKIVFTSEPFSKVPCYLCLPKDVSPPYHIMICLQGHSTGMHNSIGVTYENERKKKDIPGDRDFGLQCMAEGMAALCVEQRSFGERKELAQKNRGSEKCYNAAMHTQMLGRTLMGQRVFDVKRAVDYLASRGDMDLKHLGIMGNSTGGTISLLAAAVWPRIRLSVPSCCYGAYVDTIMTRSGCPAAFVPGLLQHMDAYDIMGLIAPRPVIIVAGEHDRIWPAAAGRRAFLKGKRIYRAARADGRCHFIVGPEGHRFYGKLTWPVIHREMDLIPG